MEQGTFKKLVLDFFVEHGRQFPWRTDYKPYHILVSEVMLQQTQTERVVPKFNAFINAFNDFEALASATPAAVLTHWQGLGYNRRGLNLHRAAQQVVALHHGELPRDTAALLALPGIGPYTAAAIQAFAFNLPTVVIETNIRAVYIHHFFPERTDKITDAELIPLIEATVDQNHPRRWYSALMDYGTQLKKDHPNPSRRSKHHVKQSKFEGSNRQIRGKVLQVLLSTGPLKIEEIQLHLTDAAPEKIEKIISEMIAEGFFAESQGVIALA